MATRRGRNASRQGGRRRGDSRPHVFEETCMVGYKCQVAEAISLALEQEQKQQQKMKPVDIDEILEIAPPTAVRTAMDAIMVRKDVTGNNYRALGPFVPTESQDARCIQEAGMFSQSQMILGYTQTDPDPKSRRRASIFGRKGVENDPDFERLLEGLTFDSQVDIIFECDDENEEEESAKNKDEVGDVVPSLATSSPQHCEEELNCTGHIGTSPKNKDAIRCLSKYELSNAACSRQRVGHSNDRNSNIMVGPARPLAAVGSSRRLEETDQSRLSTGLLTGRVPHGSFSRQNAAAHPQMASLCRRDTQAKGRDLHGFGVPKPPQNLGVGGKDAEVDTRRVLGHEALDLKRHRVLANQTSGNPRFQETVGSSGNARDTPKENHSKILASLKYSREEDVERSDVGEGGVYARVGASFMTGRKESKTKNGVGSYPDADIADITTTAPDEEESEEVAFLVEDLEEIVGTFQEADRRQRVDELQASLSVSSARNGTSRQYLNSKSSEGPLSTRTIRDVEQKSRGSCERKQSPSNRVGVPIALPPPRLAANVSSISIDGKQIESDASSSKRLGRSGAVTGSTTKSTNELQRLRSRLAQLPKAVTRGASIEKRRPSPQFRRRDNGSPPLPELSDLPLDLSASSSTTFWSCSPESPYDPSDETKGGTKNAGGVNCEQLGHAAQRGDYKQSSDGFGWPSKALDVRAEYVESQKRGYVAGRAASSANRSLLSCDAPPRSVRYPPLPQCRVNARSEHNRSEAEALPAAVKRIPSGVREGCRGVKSHAVIGDIQRRKPQPVPSLPQRSLTTGLNSTMDSYHTAAQRGRTLQRGVARCSGMR